MLGKLNRLGFSVCLGLCATAFANSAANLPIYFEDSHTGSFYWIIQNVPLNRDYQLVLIDAHSDASEILDSDSIRYKVREASGKNEMDRLVRKWRANGAVQCFNWIEPLIPHPITKVWWVAGDVLTDGQIAEKRSEVRKEINAHEMALARREGDFGDKYEVVDLDRFTKIKIEDPVIVTVDLDYFASETDFRAIRSKLERILGILLGLPHLQAITFSISRPYLASEEQSHIALYEAMNYMTHLVNADIHYEPFAVVGDDRSERAKEFYRQRKQVPRYELEQAPTFLQTFFLQNSSRIEVDVERVRWENLLKKWGNNDRVPKLTLWLGNRCEGEHEEHEVPAGEPFRLQIANWKMSPHLQVHWKVVVAAHEEFNLAEENQGFANDAPRYLLYKDEVVPATNNLLDLDGEKLIPFLDRKTGWGTLRVYCEVSDGKETLFSNVVRFSRYEGDGYTGKLTEIFNLPYIYGSALLRVGDRISADARYGADCSHFIIYGKRREGWNIPYVNPKDLLPYLELVDEFTGFHNGIAYGHRGPIVITRELIRNGLLLHFGKHVAAVFEDDEGVLAEETSVVHQLETYPEITTFATLAQRYQQIRIMTFRVNKQLAAGFLK